MQVEKMELLREQHVTLSSSMPCNLVRVFVPDKVVAKWHWGFRVETVALVMIFSSSRSAPFTSPSYDRSMSAENLEGGLAWHISLHHEESVGRGATHNLSTVMTLP